MHNFKMHYGQIFGILLNKNEDIARYVKFVFIQVVCGNLFVPIQYIPSYILHHSVLESRFSKYVVNLPVCDTVYK